jgi:hypothetical protein
VVSQSTQQEKYKNNHPEQRAATEAKESAAALGEEK